MAADVLEQLASQASLFRARDEERFEWMKALQIQVEELSKGHKTSCKALEREQVAARVFQERADELDRKLNDLQRSIDDSAFILVLLDADADAYTFKDSYFLNPDGGRRAVDDLHAQVRSSITRVKPDLARLPIVVRAYANIDGMPGYLSRLGLAQSSASLWNFAKTFSQAHAGSDFVFVGSGKDMADKKIEGVFKQFVNNPTCRHIIFGACHDNGYVRTLEDFQADRAVVERVTLLHSFEVGQEFRKLPFKSITMTSIFRTTKAAAPDVQETSSGSEHTTTTTSRFWSIQEAIE
ncbi:hypothetical protein E8E13_002559 [Curvularia kusanoi]|uniref:DUF7923 domain-containing protein n=1 Tax=Curvularia kusanoi TaxID=90978 RepID=A0A9P4T3X1_CURKU|nr:hypothetical protein E8E13_002559 [Curvularia kusanoi]